MFSQPKRVRRRGRWVEPEKAKGPRTPECPPAKTGGEAHRHHDVMRIIVACCVAGLLAAMIVATQVAGTRAEVLGVQDQLMDAICHGDAAAARQALEAGAECDPEDAALSPLAFASALGRREIVAILLDRGADTEMRRGGRGSALIHAAAGKAEDVVEDLLARGADVSAVDANRMTALHAATRAGSVRSVKALLAHGAPVDARGVDGRTALMIGTGRSAEIVDLLIAAGSNVRARDDYGRTPLIWAAMAGKVEAIERLLAAGAERSVRDHAGKDAAEWARAYRHAEAAEVLEEELAW